MLKFNKRAIIVCAAIRSKKTIIAGARHYDKIMHDAMPDVKFKGNSEQGFIDQFGNFYSRKEALDTIWQNGLQTIDVARDSKIMFSEDLY